MQDYKNALKYYKKLLNFSNAPPYVKSLISKLQYKLDGDIDVAFFMVEELYKTTKSKTLKNKLLKDLYAIKATIDLKCLNTMQSNCSKNDYFGNKYLKSKRGWKSQIEFEPYRLFNKKSR